MNVASSSWYSTIYQYHVWYCMFLHDLAWSCMFLHDPASSCMILYDPPMILHSPTWSHKARMIHHLESSQIIQFCQVHLSPHSMNLAKTLKIWIQIKIKTQITNNYQIKQTKKQTKIWVKKASHFSWAKKLLTRSCLQ